MKGNSYHVLKSTFPRNGVGNVWTIWVFTICLLQIYENNNGSVPSFTGFQLHPNFLFPSSDTFTECILKKLTSVPTISFPLWCLFYLHTNIYTSLIFDIYTVYRTYYILKHIYCILSFYLKKSKASLIQFQFNSI